MVNSCQLLIVVLLVDTYAAAAKMLVLGGFLLGCFFFGAKLDGLPPRPAQFITFLGLAAALLLKIDPPNWLPLTLSFSTMFL